MTRVLRAVAAAAFLIALVTGCTADDDVAPTSAATATDNPSEDTVEIGPQMELTFSAGRDGVLGMLLQVWQSEPVPDDDGPVTFEPSVYEVTAAIVDRLQAGLGPDAPLFDSRQYVVDAGRLDPDRPMVLSLTTRGSMAVTRDGGLTLHDAGGAVVGAIAPPTGGARFVPVDGSTVQIPVPAPPTDGTPAAPVTLSVADHALVSTEWRERSDGPSLFVDPTPWARTSGEAGWALAWAELIAAHPDADTQVMHDQLVCHGIGAVDKETWNLEPWRPDIGLLALMAARCNPTPE